MVTKVNKKEACGEKKFLCPFFYSRRGKLAIRKGKVFAKPGTRYLFFSNVHMVINMYNVMINRSYIKQTDVRITETKYYKKT